MGDVPEYVTSSESEKEETIRKRRKKINKKWEMEKVFENKASAVAAVQMEHVWSFAYKNLDTAGNVSEIFRCNNV
jgi:cell division protein FtsL